MTGSPARQAAPVPPPPQQASAFVRALADGWSAAAASLPEGGPGWLADSRSEQLAAALRQGLPGAREERWKYTSLRALEQRAFALVDADADSHRVDGALLALPGLEGPRLVFVNGRFRADLSMLDALPDGVQCTPLSRSFGTPDNDAALRRLFVPPPQQQPADAFSRINAALAGDGALLRVAAGRCIGQPLQLVFVGAAAARPQLWNVRNLVELGAGAELTLIERHLDSGLPANLGTCVSTVRLQAGARLRHVRLQQAGSAASLVARTTVQVDAGAAYCPVALELGAALSRHEWDVELAGDGAEATLRGVALAGARQLLDTRLTLRHAAGGTRSDTVWRAIAGGRARCAFHGGIVIDQGADGSDAALETKNLLLSDNAEIDAQPVLVINADEVKASHGAAVGQLDAQALFYLRSRGLPEADARHLLVQAFCRAALARSEAVRAGALHALLVDAIAQRLAQLEATP